MDERRELSAKLLIAAQGAEGEQRTQLLVSALIQRLGAMDEDLQKLRKELRTRNGAEDG